MPLANYNNRKTGKEIVFMLFCFEGDALVAVFVGGWGREVAVIFR